MTTRSFLLLPAIAVALSGCMYQTPQPIVYQPMGLPPQPAPLQAANTGAIYQASATPVAAGFRGMFEDRRARQVGDTLTIMISEKTTAHKKNTGNVGRTGSLGVSVPQLFGINTNVVNDLGVSANTSNKFDSSAANGSANDFTGTIAVQVIGVQPNGNLVVSGEKQIAIGQGNEFVRFSGIVNPANVTAANTVLSTQVADARMEYRGTGYVAEAQQMGWLSRFFLSVMPF
ncbi:flagellar basal body L-ring protein FlgH [Imbroritus primus]|uniref:flagellar basal body L-ring protein FlgH n=1 Tax=Imbroritus primus TaxID=3058603 RepID=UPI000269646B